MNDMVTDPATEKKYFQNPKTKVRNSIIHIINLRHQNSKKD